MRMARAPFMRLRLSYSYVGSILQLRSRYRCAIFFLSIHDIQAQM